MGERVNFAGAFLEARGLFSLRNWGLQRRRRRDGAFPLPGFQLPSSGSFRNHSPSTQPKVPLPRAPPCLHPRAVDPSIPHRGREEVDDQGLWYLLSCWAGLKVFGDTRILPTHLPQELPSLLGLVDVTRVQGTRVPGCSTERLVELELDHEADKVPGGGWRGVRTWELTLLVAVQGTMWSPLSPGCIFSVWSSITCFGAAPESTQSNLLMAFLLLYVFYGCLCA